MCKSKTNEENKIKKQIVKYIQQCVKDVAEQRKPEKSYWEIRFKEKYLDV